LDAQNRDAPGRLEANLCYNSIIMSQIRVVLETLGCKLNQAESESLARELSSAGYAVVPAGECADVYVLNSCTVTAVADSKSRRFIRAARRLNPEALIIATGCYAERSAAELKSAGADIVVGVSSKSNIIGLIRERAPLVAARKPATQISRTRAFVKAQDGCNRRCAYCIVPLVRGGEKSVPAAKVLGEIKLRVDEGYKEVVLTGTEVGAYSSASLGIRGLLERILGETGIERLRVSSLQPFEITPELLRLWGNPRLCPHFHISLQSGSDTVLNRMKRGYSTTGYEKAVSLIRKSLSDAGITTDVIVGFPGESEDEFEAGLEFCRKIGFARIHVFPFSARPGTAAATMTDQVTETVKRARTSKMLALAKEAAGDFRSKFVGKTAEVLWEQEESGILSGYTGNYIRVYTGGAGNLTNVLNNVKLIKPFKNGMWAEFVESEETK
jgi:threonylcarbamoyladenosine tRNA methylthiotransferase MtaB